VGGYAILSIHPKLRGKYSRAPIAFRDAAGARGGRAIEGRSGTGVHVAMCSGSGDGAAAQNPRGQVPRSRQPAAVPVSSCARRRPGIRQRATALKVRPQDRGPATFGSGGVWEAVRRSWGPDPWLPVRWRAGAQWFRGEEASSWSISRIGGRAAFAFHSEDPLAMRPSRA